MCNNNNHHNHIQRYRILISEFILSAAYCSSVDENSRQVEPKWPQFKFINTHTHARVHNNRKAKIKYRKRIFITNKTQYAHLVLLLQWPVEFGFWFSTASYNRMLQSCCFLLPLLIAAILSMRFEMKNSVVSIGGLVNRKTKIILA